LVFQALNQRKFLTKKTSKALIDAVVRAPEFAVTEHCEIEEGLLGLFAELFAGREDTW